ERPRHQLCLQVHRQQPRAHIHMPVSRHSDPLAVRGTFQQDRYCFSTASLGVGYAGMRQITHKRIREWTAVQKFAVPAAFSTRAGLPRRWALALEVMRTRIGMLAALAALAAVAASAQPYQLARPLSTEFLARLAQHGLLPSQVAIINASVGSVI